MQVITRVGANLDKKNEIKEILSIFFSNVFRMAECQSGRVGIVFKNLGFRLTNIQIEIAADIPFSPFGD